MVELLVDLYAYLLRNMLEVLIVFSLFMAIIHITSPLGFLNTCKLSFLSF